MVQENKLAIRNQEFSLAELERLASSFAKSSFFADSKDAAQAIVKIQAGRELGLPPVYSMTKIFFVQGRLTLSAEAMGALIKKSKEYGYKVVTLDDSKCVINFTHNGELEYVSTFTVEDARKAELIKEHGNWAKWPRAMLMSKCLSQGARIVCPHIISGAYTPEDFGIETDDEGYITQPQRISEAIIEGEVIEVKEKADQDKATGLQGQPTPASNAVKSPQQTAQATQQAETIKPPKAKGEKAKIDPATIHTAGDLFNAAWINFGMMRQAVLDELNVKTTTDIADIQDAYKRIASVRENK